MKKIILGIAATVLFSTASFAKSGEPVKKSFSQEISTNVPTKSDNASNSPTFTCKFTTIYTNSNGEVIRRETISFQTTSVSYCQGFIDFMKQKASLTQSIY